MSSRTLQPAGTTCTQPPSALPGGPHLRPQYGEFRQGYDKDTKDTRLVFYGLRYILEHYVARRWTLQVRPARPAV